VGAGGMYVGLISARGQERKERLGGTAPSNCHSLPQQRESGSSGSLGEESRKKNASCSFALDYKHSLGLKSVST